MAKKPAQINYARARWLRTRVNDAEFDRCVEHAENLGFRSVSDWLRDCVNESLRQAFLPEIPQRALGAPLGNRNKRGKKGANQHTKK